MKKRRQSTSEKRDQYTVVLEDIRDQKRPTFDDLKLLEKRVARLEMRMRR